MPLPFPTYRSTVSRNPRNEVHILFLYRI
ncbi:hypothetical protein K0F15_10895 [Phocaeicola vulgatus]|nr:hypothetical protein [Phocaeicola vulgatus]MCE9463061.1 hypothetical protein [Bacteroides caccae]